MVLAVVVVLVTAGCGGGMGRGPGAARLAGVPRAGTPPPAQMIVAARRLSGDRRRGTVVRGAALGERVFADGRHGFALAGVGSATYPIATLDGGRTWRINGPAFLTAVPPGSLIVGGPGTLGPGRYFASESIGGVTIVDVTTDGGRQWWLAPLPGGPVFVGSFNGALVAIVSQPVGGGALRFLVYRSAAGRVWRYAGTV